MARRRQKKRTHAAVSEEEEAKIPRTLVFKTGGSSRETSHSLTQLVQDFRQMVQPHTAINLRERKSNRFRDFASMAGPLGVSHLIAFSQSANGTTSLRIARSPRGPTLQFKVISYSLGKDVRKFVRKPKSPSADSYINPPLLVMNNFSVDRSNPKENLLTTMFQNMFPAISAHSTKVSSIKRVLLLSKDEKTGIIDIRHYMIETKLVELSRPVKRLRTVTKNTHRRIPNLSSVTDVSDLILDPNGAGAAGYSSESEVDEDSYVNLPTAASSSKSPSAQEDSKKRAVKLVEIGPRIKLELVKIEEGICSGKILYHSYISRTEQQARALEAQHKKKQSLKEARRKEQEENVKRKTEGKSSRMKRGKEKAAELPQDDEMDETEEENENEENEAVDESESE